MAKTTEAAIERVKKVLVANELMDKNEELNLSDTIYDNLGLDSLDMVEFVMSLEDEFNIEIADDSFYAEDIKTIQDVVNLVEILSK